MEVVRGQLSSVMTRLDRVPQTLRYAVAGLSIGLFVPAFFYYYLLRDVYPKNVRLGFLLLLVPSIYFLCMLVAYLLMKFWNYTKTSGKSLFLVGAILFTGGFICLMWATFLPVV
jgi:hypothetical protein